MILLAVVLFVAFSYAVKNSIRGEGKIITSEQYQTYIAEFMGYGQLIENTVHRLILTNNCTKDQINFYTFGKAAPRQHLRHRFKVVI